MLSRQEMLVTPVQRRPQRLLSGKRRATAARQDLEAIVEERCEAPHPEVPGGPGFAGGDFTACILRFDPAKGQQVPEVYSRGNRNPFGFDWDDKGRLIDAENGPMADHPEELNHIQQGKHYGFPYVFGNNERPDYPDAPAPPKGLKFEPPLKNLGPAGLLGDHPMYSLAPHSAPGGLVLWLQVARPRALRLDDGGGDRRTRDL